MLESGIRDPIVGLNLIIYIYSVQVQNPTPAVGETKIPLKNMSVPRTCDRVLVMLIFAQTFITMKYGGLLFDPLKTHGVIYEYGAVFFGPLKTDGLNYGDGGINFCPIKNRRREL